MMNGLVYNAINTKRRIRSVIMILVLLVGLVFAGCSNHANPTNNAQRESKSPESIDNNRNTLTVYTTTLANYEFTKVIGGEFVEVNNIVPVGVDSHDFEPSAQTMIGIAKADLVVYNGGGFELWIDKLHEAVGKESHVILLDTTQDMKLMESDEVHADDMHESDIDHKDDHEHGFLEELWHTVRGWFSDSHDHDHDAHDHGDFDPHVWLNPLLAIEQADKIAKTLAHIDPANAEYYQTNSMNLKQQLLDLDAEFENALNDMPNHKFFVSHKGYSYLAERYGLEQVAINGIHPGAEPSQKEIQTIIDEMKALGIQHLFFETTVSNKIANVIKDEIGADVLFLHPLENYTEQDIQNQETYFTLMRKNLGNLVMAFAE
ncbi:hypothetical protein BHU72_04660 [Desulfuribacillus stibiiarsenatis]|uniref:ABC transporter substrate-binding protein n=1 Tax=Desulfuribacillus stibiiarsenatis TaxID=1390249 RepID=A0A1E5L5H7_9FIRM|nr:zinc ABC transporter substrate-binding protein [Desulfuribacillus stibiiarsenatis]OEH85385.1 hypothetical protein BHU72_04660 [Desulfuribacillus stibiiarsenatis]